MKVRYFPQLKRCTWLSEEAVFIFSILASRMSNYYGNNNKTTYDAYGNPVGGRNNPYSVQVDQPAPVGTAVPVRALKPRETPPTGWRDLPFAILFYVNFGAMVVFAIMWGIPKLTEDDTTSSNKSSSELLTTSETRTVIGVAVGLAGVAAVISLAIIQLVVKFAKGIITFALWFSVGMAFATAAVGFLLGAWIMGIVGLAFAALFLWYVVIIILISSLSS